jgi:CRP-like cAMP-binding protein
MKPHDETELAQLKLFDGCTDQEMEMIRSLSIVISVPVGTELIHQGSTARQFIIIKSGEVSVEHDGRRIAVAGPGDIVGEISLIEGSGAQRTARTMTPTELFVFSKPEFASMMNRIPTVAQRVQHVAIQHLLQIEAHHHAHR